jgi:hypothetical protein
MPERTVFPRVKSARFKSGNLPNTQGFALEDTLFEHLDPSCVRGLVLDDLGIPVEMRAEHLPPEHYHLSISPKGAVVATADERGALQALRTLAHLASQGPLPIGEIDDGPDLAIRACHLDLKDQLPSRDYIFDFIDRIAAMKYNAVVVEYEDKFPFSEEVRPRAKDCWTPEQVVKFVEFCRVRGIEVIPLIQTLGHLEFLTPFHPEISETPAMLCPSNPSSAELVNVMADDILALHPASRFLHLGADETWDLGACHTCRDTADHEGKGVLYGRHMDRIISHVLEKQVRPMIWADMVLSHPEAFDFIDHATVMVDWEYWPYGERVDKVNIWGLGQHPNETWEDVPEEQRELFGEYTEIESGDCWAESYPFTEMLREKGYDVIVASAVRSHGDPYTHPDWTFHLPNVWAAARTAVEDGALGSLVTSWAIRRTLPELTMMGIAAGAECMWQAHIADSRWLVDFPARFGEVFLGDRAAGMAEYGLSVRGLGYDETLTQHREGSGAEWAPPPRFDRIKRRLPKYPELDHGALSARMAVLDRSASALQLVQPKDSAKKHVELFRLAADEALLKAWIFRVLARLESVPADKTALKMAKHLHAQLREIKERAARMWKEYLTPAALTSELSFRFDEEDAHLHKALKRR